MQSSCGNTFDSMKLFHFSFAILLGLTSLLTNAQHSVVLKNGEKISGVVMAIQNDTLQIAINRRMNRIPLIKVSSIFLDEYVPYDGSFDPNVQERSIRSREYLIRYLVKDREMIVAPKLSNATENRGIVVVDVDIDKYGNVTKVKAGGIGSTTTNEYLYTKAEFACKGARFNENPKGPINTKGQIIITY